MSLTLASDWPVALAAAAPICIFCYATIPLWQSLGFAGAGYHALRLIVIGLVLGSVPRASLLGCTFLLLMIAAGNFSIDARATDAWTVLDGRAFYSGLIFDGAAMATSLVLIQLARIAAKVSRRFGFRND
jgi:hypothetical protein